MDGSLTSNALGIEWSRRQHEESCPCDLSSNGKQNIGKGHVVLEASASWTLAPKC